MSDITTKIFVKKALADLIKAKKDQNEYDASYVEATRVLAYLDQDDLIVPNETLSEGMSWRTATVKELTMFFMKCVLAAIPAVLLFTGLYILLAVFLQTAPMILGL